MKGSIWKTLGALLIAGAAFGDRVVVEDRVVATQADGPCTDLLTAGSQRYVDCGNGTVFDTTTNLLWLRDANCPDLGTLGSGRWVEGQRDVADLQDPLCGLSDGSQPGDWRLPTLDEWETTIEAALSFSCFFGGVESPPSLTDDTGTECFGDGSQSSFSGVSPSGYWSATADQNDPSDAEWIDLGFGLASAGDKSDSDFTQGVWPVRQGGGPGSSGTVLVEDSVVETQADGPCYEESGAGEERYVDCGDGTVLDLVTDLLWLKDASCSELPETDALGRSSWTTGMAVAAALAGPLCGLSDGSQPGDWRLPTKEEWDRTMDRAQELDCTSSGANDPPTLTDVTGTLCFSDGTSPFEGVSTSPSLTASVYALRTDRVFYASLSSGSTVLNTKAVHYTVWPVRERK